MSTFLVVACDLESRVPDVHAATIFNFDGCPIGQVAFLVDPALIQPVQDVVFDPLAAAGFFSFGFGLPLFFYVLGLVGHALIRPFWRS